MRVGIFGGSFNPPHTGHLALACAAYESGGLDKVVFIPCGNPPHKDTAAFASAEHRLEMTRLLINGDPRFEVSDMEIRSMEKSYTANTLKKLREIHPDWELCFILGEDSLRDMKTWYKPDEIFARAEVLAAVRGGLNHSDFDKICESYRLKYGAVIRRIDMDETEVSASFIRKNLDNRDAVKYMLTDKVKEYIKEKGIYRENCDIENRY